MNDNNNSLVPRLNPPDKRQSRIFNWCACIYTCQVTSNVTIDDLIELQLNAISYESILTPITVSSKDLEWKPFILTKGPLPKSKNLVSGFCPSAIWGYLTLGRWIPVQTNLSRQGDSFPQRSNVIGWFHRLPSLTLQMPRRK